MKIFLNGFDIKKWLASEFWSGKRWITYDAHQQVFKIEDLRCFQDYKVAANHCMAQSNSNRSFQIVVLGALLKCMNGRTIKKLDSKELDYLKTLFARYPISVPDLYGDTKDYEMNDVIFPAVWNLAINPLTYMDCYYIVNNTHGNHNSEKTKRTPYQNYIIMSFNRFSDAMDEFRHLSSINHVGNQKIIFVGQFMGQKIKFDEKGLPIQNSGLQLFSLKREKQDKFCSIQQLNDPTTPYHIPIPMFVRYKKEKGKIEFLDGTLKKILAGYLIEYIDLEYYSFGQNIKFNENIELK